MLNNKSVSYIAKATSEKCDKQKFLNSSLCRKKEVYSTFLTQSWNLFLFFLQHTQIGLEYQEANSRKSTSQEAHFI
jgi:hypothetical protein